MYDNAHVTCDVSWRNDGAMSVVLMDNRMDMEWRKKRTERHDGTAVRSE